MMSQRAFLGASVIVACAFAARAAALDLAVVPIGNPGNPDDAAWRPYGGVAYAYEMGKYEVTAGQYTTFLNAVAAADTYGLYNPEMWSNEHGCKIQRVGVSGGYTYNVAPDRADRPVNFVSWGDAARFANWLYNDQPNGVQGPDTTEAGSYFLNGASSWGDLMGVARAAGATWVIPSEDEWYKSAYHKNDGITGNYFDYPTGTDAVPSNDVTNPDAGNSATFYDHNGYSIGAPYYRTVVGAHENSDSPYGTFDQGGNVWEWMETAQSTTDRRMRGGGYSYTGVGDYSLNRSYAIWNNPTGEYSDGGFRVALVPEPASLALLAVAGLLLLRRR